MRNNSEISRVIPNSVEKVALVLKRMGFIGFWMQIVLGIISSVTLFFAVPSLVEYQQKNQGIGFGIFCAVCSLILLLIAIIFCFRYGKIARKITDIDPTRRPRKSDTIQLIRIGLIINLAGMLMAIIGAEALIGINLAKTFAYSPQSQYDTSRDLVKSFDMLIIQANAHTITAHFSGIITSLWLLNRITK